MASDVPTMPVNGNYAAHQGYGSVEQQQQQQQQHNAGAFGSNNATPHTSYGQAAPPSSSTPGPAAAPAQQEIPKDEVGWYFVEQYYTTLSRSPEKLYLFYNKRSQFVSGQETDKVAVCVGQRAINDRIKELDFQDCKVRVTNVDSQASDANIVIQVIGEISNKSQPHKKFTQTFVLATQTNGYFVLNDIFRYIIEEEDEPEAEATPAEEELQQVPQPNASGYQEPPTTAGEVESKTLTSSEDPHAIENDAQKVDKELEEKVIREPSQEQAAPTAVNGDSEPAKEELSHAEDAPVAASEPVQPDTSELAEVEPVEALKDEKPVDPKPTPQASPPKQAPPQPATAPKPAVPKTWANLAAAANRSAIPATPVAPASATSASSQPRPTPPTTKATPPAVTGPSAAPPSAPAAQREPSPAGGAQDEWTAVGGSHNRQQSRQTNGQQLDSPQWRGYIKNVHEGVDENELKRTLEQSGELIYFDIARQKNCAFVDFKTKEGYDAAIANSPHTISNERLYVEERKFKPGATPYIPRGQFQGNRGRGAGNPNAPRGGFQGRGGFPPRGATRGGGPTGPAPRGRGGAQPT